MITVRTFKKVWKDFAEVAFSAFNWVNARFDKDGILLYAMGYDKMAAFTAKIPSRMFEEYYVEEPDLGQWFYMEGKYFSNAIRKLEEGEDAILTVKDDNLYFTFKDKEYYVGGKIREKIEPYDFGVLFKDKPLNIAEVPGDLLADLFSLSRLMFVGEAPVSGFRYMTLEFSDWNLRILVGDKCCNSIVVPTEIPRVRMLITKSTTTIGMFHVDGLPRMGAYEVITRAEDNSPVVLASTYWWPYGIEYKLFFAPEVERVREPPMYDVVFTLDSKLHIEQFKYVLMLLDKFEFDNPRSTSIVKIGPDEEALFHVFDASHTAAVTVYVKPVGFRGYGVEVYAVPNKGPQRFNARALAEVCEVTAKHFYDVWVGVGTDGYLYVCGCMAGVKVTEEKELEYLKDMLELYDKTVNNILNGYERGEYSRIAVEGSKLVKVLKEFKHPPSVSFIAYVERGIIYGLIFTDGREIETYELEGVRVSEREYDSVTVNSPNLPLLPYVRVLKGSIIQVTFKSFYPPYTKYEIPPFVITGISTVTIDRDAIEVVEALNHVRPLEPRQLAESVILEILRAHPEGLDAGEVKRLVLARRYSPRDVESILMDLVSKGALSYEKGKFYYRAPPAPPPEVPPELKAQTEDATRRVRELLKRVEELKPIPEKVKVGVESLQSDLEGCLGLYRSGAVEEFYRVCSPRYKDLDLKYRELYGMAEGYRNTVKEISDKLSVERRVSSDIGSRIEALRIAPELVNWMELTRLIRDVHDMLAKLPVLDPAVFEPVDRKLRELAKALDEVERRIAKPTVPREVEEFLARIKGDLEKVKADASSYLEKLKPVRDKFDMAMSRLSEVPRRLDELKYFDEPVLDELRRVVEGVRGELEREMEPKVRELERDHSELNRRARAVHVMLTEELVAKARAYGLKLGDIPGVSDIIRQLHDVITSIRDNPPPELHKLRDEIKHVEGVLEEARRRLPRPPAPKFKVGDRVRWVRGRPETVLDRVFEVKAEPVFTRGSWHYVIDGFTVPEDNLEPAPPPPPEAPREPPEKPKVVEEWEKRLRINIVGWKEEVPPGFRYPVWVLWVRDEATGEVVRVVMGYPYTEHHRYKLVKVTNKAGHPVNLLAFVEEAPRVEVKVPPAPEASKVVREAEAKVETVKPEEVRAAVEEVTRMLATKPFNWSEFKADVRRFYQAVAGWERAVEERNDTALYGYLTTFKDRMRIWLDRIGREIGETHTRATEAQRTGRLPAPKISREEIEKLWRYWEETLKKHGVDPYKYKAEYFDEDVALASSYEEALKMIDIDLKFIIAQEELSKKTFEAEKVVKPPERFNWKDVGRGIAYVKLRLMWLEEATDRRDLMTAYELVREALDATYRLLEILSLSPNVRKFKDITGL